MKTSALAAALAILSVSVPAHAGLTLADNFNDGSTSGWTVQNGSLSESAGLFSGSNTALATLNGASGNALGVDAVSGAGVSYVALIFGFGSLDENLFVKIQDNNGNGLFDRVFVYKGNNGTGHSYGHFDLSSEVSSTLFSATLSGTSLAAFVEGTGQTFSATLDQTFADSGVGLGFYGGASADNFYVEGGNGVPEPASLALLGIGLAGLGLGRCRSIRSIR